MGIVGGDSDVGGFVGYLGSGGSITSCYSTVHATGSSNIGGLIGRLANNGTIVASYYDNSIVPIGIGNLAAGHSQQSSVSKSTSELQTPMNYTDIYTGWNIDLDNEDGDGERLTGVDDPWDFAGNNRYPKLKFDFNNDGVATSC